MSVSPLGYSLSPEILAAFQNPNDAGHRIYSGPNAGSADTGIDQSLYADNKNYNYGSDVYNNGSGNVFDLYDNTGKYIKTNAWEQPNTMADLTKAAVGIGGAYLGAGALSGMGAGAMGPFNAGSLADIFPSMATDSGGGGGILDSLLGEGGGAGGDALAEGFGQGVNGTQAGASLTGATGSGTLPSFTQSLPQFTAPTAAGGIGSSILSGLKDISPYAPLISSVGDYFLKQNMGNKQMGQFQQTQDKINGLYAPGSPEYNYLDQKLQREAAASGRNSQSGQLATNLAATIAQIKANAMGQSLGNQNQQFNTALTNQSSGLNSLFFNLMKHYGE